MLQPDKHAPPIDDPFIAEIRRIRAEQSAALGHDIERIMEDSWRSQFRNGNDVVVRSKSGRFEVVFKGSGKPIDEYEGGRNAAAATTLNRGEKDDQSIREPPTW